jgi:hypothetical protein
LVEIGILADAFGALVTLTGIHQQEPASAHPSGAGLLLVDAIFHKIARTSSGVCSTVKQTSGWGEGKVVVAFFRRGLVMASSRKIPTHPKMCG